MNNQALYYQVGALLYAPANHESIMNSIIDEKFSTPYSLALCLEDTIADEDLDTAMDSMLKNIVSLYKRSLDTQFYIPKIFIRVREAAQISYICQSLAEAVDLIYGFIFPKFSLSNADAYISEILKVNSLYAKTFYFMPIYESKELIDLRYRYDVLYQLKDKLDKVEELVLNIRVGGTDLCHLYGMRRSSYENVYNIPPVYSLISDIISVYGKQYVLSAPVWEYYAGKNWDEGLRTELRLDKLSGFIGKTIIHPKQIAIINEEFMVARHDYEDALSILNWKNDKSQLVSSSFNSERMNEVKTHSNWARRILYRAEYFGIID